MYICIHIYIYSCSLNFLTTKILVGNQVFIVKLFYARYPVLEWNWNWNHSFIQPWSLTACPWKWMARCQAMVPPEELAAVWVHKAPVVLLLGNLDRRFPAAIVRMMNLTLKVEQYWISKHLGFAWLWGGGCWVWSNPVGTWQPWLDRWLNDYVEVPKHLSFCHHFRDADEEKRELASFKSWDLAAASIWYFWVQYGSRAYGLSEVIWVYSTL